MEKFGTDSEGILKKFLNAIKLLQMDLLDDYDLQNVYRFFPNSYQNQFLSLKKLNLLQMGIKQFVKYEELPIDFKKKVLLKYMRDKMRSLIQINNGDSSFTAMEIWQNDFYYLVFVDKRTLDLIHWDVYLETGDENEFISIPYLDDLADIPKDLIRFYS